MSLRKQYAYVYTELLISTGKNIYVSAYTHHEMCGSILVKITVKIMSFDCIQPISQCVTKPARPHTRAARVRARAWPARATDIVLQHFLL